jgi:protease stability complex PrcB-like protein
MVRVGPILLLILLSACSTSADPVPSDGGSQEAQEPRDLRVERVASGAPGEGSSDPRVVLAPSAEALSKDLGPHIRGSGDGTYLAAYGGQQPTGGYSVGVAGARVEGDRVTVRVLLEGPPSDAIVTQSLTQSLTYPYEISVLRGLAPEGKNFSFVDGDDRKLGWPVRRVGE